MKTWIIGMLLVDYDNDLAHHSQCFTHKHTADYRVHRNTSECTTLPIKLKTFIMTIKS